MKKLLLSFSFLALGYTANAQTWVEQATGFDAISRGISQISIVDANTVWGLAFDGSGLGDNVQEFTLTTNGGSSWTPGTINVEDPLLEINNISAVSATTAWVSALIPAAGNGVIYKTSDGGASWVQQNAAGFQTTGESFLNGVHFFDANTGVCFGDPANGEFEIYRTTNGGTTWTLVPAANIPNPLSGEWGYNGGNTASGSSIWLVTNKGRLLKSTDMGLNWTVSQAPLTDFSGTSQSGSVIFSDANNGALLKTAGTTYTFYTTSNGGTTWTAGTPYTGTYRLLCYVPGTTTIVATGAGPTTGGNGSAYSNNNGTTWTTIDSNIQHLTPAFLNASTGWSGSFNQDPFVGGIFKLSGSLANESFTSTKFKVYPNPTTSVVNLQTEGLDSYKLKVTDLSGKVMLTKEFSGVENSLDISGFATGVYFFEINSGRQSETIKIMKN